MKNTALPILTFPFIILTWFMLLVSYRLKAFQLSNTLVPQSLSHWELNIAGEVNWTEGIFNGIGQIFFWIIPYLDCCFLLLYFGQDGNLVFML